MKNKIKDISIIFIYTVIIVLLYIYLCISRIQGIDNCIQDIYCYIEHNTKALIIPFFLMVLFNYNKDFMRTNYIIRFQNIKKWMICIIKQQAYVSLLAALWQTFVTTVGGLACSKIHNTWNLYSGRPYYVMKSITNINIPEQTVPIIFFICIFMELFVSASVFVMIWGILETPVIGYIVAAVMVIAEYQAKLKIFFGVVDLEPVNIYQNGFQIYRYTVYPICIFLICFVLCIVVLRRKNYYRLY